jgi:hypothetical protein
MSATLTTNIDEARSIHEQAGGYLLRLGADVYDEFAVTDRETAISDYGRTTAQLDYLEKLGTRDETKLTFVFWAHYCRKGVVHP